MGGAVAVVEAPARSERVATGVPAPTSGVARAPAMAQVNVRMRRELKEAGDAALAAMGISPSELVRGVWAKAAEGDVAIGELMEMLGMRRRTAEEQAEIDRKRAIIDHMAHSFEEFGKRFGLDLSTLPPLEGKEALREAAWAEREEKWRAGGWQGGGTA